MKGAIGLTIFLFLLAKSQESIREMVWIRARIGCAHKIDEKQLIAHLFPAQNVTCGWAARACLRLAGTWALSCMYERSSCGGCGKAATCVSATESIQVMARIHYPEKSSIFHADVGKKF
jgi:hypothetical protein